MYPSTNEYSNVEGEKMLQCLIDSGYTFYTVKDERATLITFPNPFYKPDNGSNPFIACELEDVINAVNRNDKIEDLSDK